MKKMTCKQLGGACDMEFFAETFEDISKQSQQHGMEQFQKGDTAHLEAMSQMQSLMQEPKAMEEWMSEMKSLFNQQPEL
jgi:hypothetical protein